MLSRCSVFYFGLHLNATTARVDNVPGHSARWTRVPPSMRSSVGRRTLSHHRERSIVRPDLDTLVLPGSRARRVWCSLFRTTNSSRYAPTGVSYSVRSLADSGEVLSLQASASRLISPQASTVTWSGKRRNTNKKEAWCPRFKSPVLDVYPSWTFPVLSRAMALLRARLLSAARALARDSLLCARLCT